MGKLSDQEAGRILRKARIPLVKQFLARTESQAVSFSRSLGFPVVMKVSSPDIIHKTEKGGVFLDIRNENEALRIFRKIKNKFKGPVLIQEQVSGIEVIVGSKIDPTFGPVIMFGLGGILVEVLRDVAFRLVPIARKDAREMVQEVRGFPILKGVRGQKPINFKKLEDFLLRASKMVVENPRIKELDINPVFANSKGALAADVRILV